MTDELNYKQLKAEAQKLKFEKGTVRLAFPAFPNPNDKNDPLYIKVDALITGNCAIHRKYNPVAEKCIGDYVVTHTPTGKWLAHDITKLINAKIFCYLMIQAKVDQEITPDNHKDIPKNIAEKAYKTRDRFHDIVKD